MKGAHKQLPFHEILLEFQTRRGCAWKGRSENAPGIFENLWIVSEGFQSFWDMSEDNFRNPDENLTPLHHQKLAGIAWLVHWTSD